jgi:hypothetical protein
MNGPEPAWATRFWAKVDFNGPIPAHRPDLGPCHIWTASVTEKRGGYGQFRLDGRMRKAHQIALELAGVEIPSGHVSDHLCRNPPCVRQTHLEPVTYGVNFLRSEHPTAITVRSNICRSGRHELTEDNTIMRDRNGKPNRECRLCDNEGQRLRRIARKAAA